MASPVVTAAEMREIDRITIEERGIPGILLMENAGTAVARNIRKYFGPLSRKKIAVVCGKGNNGGDGMVVARLLLKECAAMNVFLISGGQDLRGDAYENYMRAKAEGIIIDELGSILNGNARNIISGADVIVDAIFGTGISAPVSGLYGEVIGFLNSVSGKIVSVDIPSGLSSDTGEIKEPSVKASMTVTLGLPKIASLVYPAAGYMGELVLADIGIPEDVVVEKEINVRLLCKNDVTDMLPLRRRDTHKGDFGHVLVVGGSPGKTGAVVMAARAAQRSGAGLVTVVVPKSLNMAIETSLLEAMSFPMPETEKGTLSSSGIEKLLRFSEGKSVIAIGPGLGTDEETLDFLSSFLAEIELPVVLDADAINLIAMRPEILRKRKFPCLLTPHPGEMGRLAGITSAEVQKRRLETCSAIASEFNATVVLKGKNSIISCCGKKAFINSTGNPGMASGGSGDVLTGIISAFIAQKIDLPGAASAGTFIHGLAGDIGASKTGEQSLIARDIINHIPSAIRDCLKES